MAFEIGSAIGDYEVVGVLGAGGMGTVYKVRNTVSDRIEAMKVLSPDLVADPGLADRFLREIKVHAGLDHPNIAGLRTALRHGNQLLMVIELVEGVTLEKRARQGRIPVDEAANYIGQVLDALAYAHRRGVIHRDIKPANMMLMPDGTVKLLDFGIAKGAADRKLTMTGTTLGSLYYMSPEQIRGTDDVDARADLYSVGVSLYELVTGKRPFDGDSQYAIMAAHLEREPVPPVTIDPALPQVLNDLILFSVNKEPGGRFQTAEAFRNALLSVSGAAVPVPAAAPAVVPVAVAAKPRSGRMLWVAAGAALTAGAVIGLIQFGPWSKTGAHPAAVVTPAKAPPATAEAPPVPTPVEPSEPPPRQEPRGQAAAAPAPRQDRPRVEPQKTLLPPPTVPAVQYSSPPVAVPSVAAPAPPQPAPSVSEAEVAAKRAELQEVRESLVMLSARAGAVRTSLQNLQRSQAASGLGMRSDWVQAASLMDSFLKGSNDALAAGDARAARGLMEKAETQVDRLEKALNK